MLVWKQKKNNAGLWSACTRIMSEIEPYRVSFCLSVFLSIISTLLGISSSVLLGRLTDTVLNGGSFGDYQAWVFLMTAVISSILIGLLTQYHWGALTQRINHSLREKTMMKIHNLGHSWFESHTTGDIIIRLNDDLGQVIALYSQFRTIGLSLLSGIIFLVIMAWINPLLAIVSLLFPFLMQWFIFRSSKKLDLQFQQRQKLLSEVSACSEEALGGINEIKAMNFSFAFCRKYNAKVSSYVRQLIHLDRLCSKNDTILESLGHFQSLIFIIIGGLFIFLRYISVGDFLIARMLTGNLNATVGSLNFFNLRMQLVSANRIFEVWDAEERFQVYTSQTEEFASKNNVLELKNVSFSYPQRIDVAALEDVSLSVFKGEKVAIIGLNGSGKSTLLKLIAGFYTPTIGSVFTCSDNSHSHVALVEQDTFLFSDTYYHNIACGNANKLLNDDVHLNMVVKHAAKTACIEEYILATEHGYQNMCIAPGSNLSGGQRQRMAIARCLCSEAEVILLDEPTRALDSDTKFLVMNQIMQAFQNKTVIFVTHDMALIQNFDKIVVLDGGRIVAQGSHQELIKNNGLYATFVKDVVS